MQVYFCSTIFVFDSLFQRGGRKAQALMDVVEPLQLGLQDPATPVMEGIVNFHNYLMIFLVGIAAFVGWLLIVVLSNYDKEPTRSTFYQATEGLTHATLLEVVWTIIPAAVLLLIAVPSFSLLYSLDDSADPSVTLKIVGHQWFWSYEYSDFNMSDSFEPLAFDSYMVPEEDLTIGAFRLLEVDNRVILPEKTAVRLLVTAADVLHSWAVPSFGLKIDAIPGRLSQSFIFADRSGVFYGQCSEICGVNHGFMPIVVRTVTQEAFTAWVARRIEA